MPLILFLYPVKQEGDDGVFADIIRYVLFWYNMRSWLPGH